ncbi:MAG: hypothetical protein AB1641_02205 [Thermodesulfobacteriota bacterium]
MKPRQKQSVILSLIDELKENGSWCGETHIQKSAFFLEELTEVPLELNFIMYKHGPFSFELRDELTAMRADGLLEIRLHPYPYGPNLTTTSNGQRLQKRWPQTHKKYAHHISFVAKHFGGFGVAELERLGTALYISKRNPNDSLENRAKHITNIKPHITSEEAINSVRFIDELADKYQDIGL